MRTFEVMATVSNSKQLLLNSDFDGMLSIANSATFFEQFAHIFIWYFVLSNSSY